MSRLEDQGSVPWIPAYCDKLNERLVAYEEVRNRVGFDIPEEDAICFIRPYENKKRLQEILIRKA